MKKSLFAVAAVTAFAGAAQAQSSVTVYGILDVGFIGGNTTVTTSAPTKGAQVTTKTTGNQFGNSAEQTSRLGFKGNEDLGGGTSAFFTAEFQLSPTDTNLSGNLAGSTTAGSTSVGGLLNRQTFVGLKKNGIGQAAIGTQYTPVFNAGAVTDPGQYNNMMGGVIYAFSSGPAANAFDSSTGNTVAFTTRLDNSLTFQSEKFAGFGVSGMYVLNNKNTTQYQVTGTGINAGSTAGGNTNTNGWGLGVDYELKKFYVAGAYQSFTQFTTAINASATGAQPFNAAGAGLVTLAPTNVASSATGVATIPVTQGQNVRDNQGYIGATYDFGILKAYAQYVTRQATATYNNSYFVKRTAEQLGVRSYITPTIEAWASAGLGRYTALGVTQPTANFNGWQLGSNYYLSKRTNLYAIYGATTTSNYAVTDSTGKVTATNSNSGQNYAIGVRHTF